MVFHVQTWWTTLPENEQKINKSRGTKTDHFNSLTHQCLSFMSNTQQKAAYQILQGYYQILCLNRMLSNIPCAILLCGCDNTVVNRHRPLHRLADWYHHLLLVLLLYHLLIFITHRYLSKVSKVKKKKDTNREHLLHFAWLLSFTMFWLRSIYYRSSIYLVKLLTE